MTDEVVTVTPQRRAQGKIVETSRGAVAGGNVAGIGQHDAWAFYPDFLLEMRLLGEEPECLRRRNAAFSFAELWSQTHRSEKTCIPDGSAGAQPGDKPTAEEETRSHKALMEMRWLLTQRYLGAHRPEVEMLCLELHAPAHPVRIEGIPELKRSNKPADLRLAAELIETREKQQASINTHIKGFLARSGVMIDALDALEKALERATEETPRGND